MNYNDDIIYLPEHWEKPIEDRINPYNIDQFRDYDLPFFHRKDSLARIFFTINPSFDCIFTIKFDYHNDVQCMKTLEESITFADNYIKEYPLQFEKCSDCNLNAVWYYLPDDSPPKKNRYFCEDHVKRGCSCNVYSDGEEELQDVNGILKQLPCIEYHYGEYGFPIELK